MTDLTEAMVELVGGDGSVGFAGPKLAKPAKAGAARGIRTPDPVITNDVLYRLSYCGNLAGTKALPAPIRALLISGMARIGKDKRGSN